MLTLGVFATALLLGAMVFFAAIVAPVTFTALDAPNAARHTRATFPRYYLYLAVLAGVAALAALAVGRMPDAALMGAVAASTVLLRQVLMPRLNAWRDAELAGDAAAGKKFSQGHKASVAINLAQMLVATLVLFLLANA
jgi:hypothetical protein